MATERFRARVINVRRATPHVDVVSVLFTIGNATTTSVDVRCGTGEFTRNEQVFIDYDPRYPNRAELTKPSR